MNYRIYILLILIFLCNFAKATHNRAGEITFRHIQGYEYEITITTYTYTKSLADRDELTVLWGDDDTRFSIAPRIDSLIRYLPNDYKKNVYKARHTYPGPSNYTILVQDPNRNFGIKNIPNSVNVIFAITTTLVINANFESNNTPILLNPPTDRAALGHLFIHNPGAYDPDGDSLSYSLEVNRGEGGKPIAGYTLPPSSNTPMYIDPISGNLVWDSPIDTGAYNVAIKISEWRDGVKIGSLIRDMQIDVYKASNNPPDIEDMDDICVIAGQSFSRKIKGSDPDNDSVTLSAQGGAFEFKDSPAEWAPVLDSSSSKNTTKPGWFTMKKDISGSSLLDTTGKDNKIVIYDTLNEVIDDSISHLTYDYSTINVSWATTCSHIRKQPYNFIIRADDNNEAFNMVSLKSMFVRVIAPPPENLQAITYENTINLIWEPGECAGAKFYKIYRFEGSSYFTPDSCQTGIPESAEFTFIGQTENDSVYSFFDDNSGQGLIPGIEYCYRVVAVYPDGAESIASEETCATLKPGSPPIITVSLHSNKYLETDSIEVAWIKPEIPDTIDPPYRYKIYRSDFLKKENLDLLKDIPNANPSDTIYIDYTAIDTSIVPYTYSVEFYGNYNGQEELLGKPELAATLYPTPEPGDNKITLTFNKFSPWIDTAHVIYRKNNPEANFDSVGITYKKTFTDIGLKNHKTYWYKAKSLGWRKINDYRFSNENFSHPVKAIPYDNEPPCPPVLSVHANCDSLINILTWNNPNNSCADDVISYRIYYAFDNKNNLSIIDSVMDAELTAYMHQPIHGPIGFYGVTSVDSFRNESVLSNIVAVDTCKGYDLPNTFSPNNDGENDLFTSYNPNNYVKEIDMQIFNRWGQLMYKTTDPAVNWDGTSMISKQKVSDGVYFYICTVYEPGIFNTQLVYRPRQLTGFIQVFTQEIKQIPIIEDY